MENHYDLIIAGAGPIGLAAAILAGRNHLKTLVIEKAAIPSPDPRGETLHYHPILGELIGEETMRGMSHYETAGRLFHSPKIEKEMEKQSSTPSLVFEWRDFIDALFEEAKKANCEFKFNEEVLGPIFSEESGACIGVHTSNGRYHATTTFIVTGAESSPGRALGVHGPDLISPTVKCVVSNIQNTYEGFEYFFISPHQFPEFEGHPGGVLFIFPRGNQNAEIGMMLFTDLEEDVWSTETVSTEQIQALWDHLKQSYGLFAERLQGTRIEYEKVTGIPMKQLVTPTMPRPGVVLLGDAAGFVEISGGSGLVAGMEAAQFWVQYLSTHSNSWTEEHKEYANKEFEQTKVFKHIKKVYALVGRARGWIFKKLRTPEKINKRWWLISFLYKLM